MSKLKDRTWWEAAGNRAIRTIAQAALSTIGAAAFVTEVKWPMVVSAAIMAGILSLLTSIATLPEYSCDKNECLDDDGEV